MSKRPVITPVSVGAASQAINENLNRIAEAFDNTVSRDGSIPNQMRADVDMNGNDLLNVKNIDVDTLSVSGVVITIDNGNLVLEGVPFDFVAVYEGAQV